jgi:DNA-directed RNA polymerase subunit alpha
MDSMDFVAKNWRDLIRPSEHGVLEHTPTHATLRYEPLERGFGTTLGLVLRRTLLSLPGAAVTHVACSNVAPACLDEIVPGLIELVFTSEHPTTAIVRLDRDGPGNVTGADIALVDGVRCCNPAHRICTLPGPARLALQLAIGPGRGYAPAERHASILPGAIPIAAMFAPVRRVGVEVTNARVGHRTDYDGLMLDVSTNGAIDPVDAVSRAAEIIRDQLDVFLNFEEPVEPIPVPHDHRPDLLRDNLWRTVEELELSMRTTNCLRNLRITYIGELVKKTSKELMTIRGFGRKSLTEIESVLAAMELRIGMKVEGWPDAKPAEPR